MTPRRKLIIAVVVFIIIVISVIVIAIVQTSSNNSSTDADNSPKQTSYVDPDSGETIITTEGRVKEGEETGILILGSSRFLDMGLSAVQYETAQEYILDYAKTATLDSKPITQISIVKASIKQPIDPNSGEKSFIANIRINKTALQQLKLSYRGVTQLEAQVFNLETGVVLYTSPAPEEDHDH